MASKEVRVSDPALSINNESVLVEPNSVKIILGYGETKTSSCSRGGGNIVTVVSEDVTTKVGKVKFECPNTINTIKAGKGWKGNPGGNFIELSGSAGGKTFTAYIQSASVDNDPEFEFGVDGKTSYEMSGAPAE